jgi:hypothetical protein
MRPVFKGFYCGLLFAVGFELWRVGLGSVVFAVAGALFCLGAVFFYFSLQTGDEDE